MLLKNILKNADIKELLKGTLIAFIFRGLGIVSGYLFMIFVTKKLGASGWGIFSIINLLLYLFSTVSRFGTDASLLKFVSEFISRNEHYFAKLTYKRIFNYVFTTSIFTSFILFYSSQFLSINLFHNKALIFPLKITAITIPFFNILWLNREVFRALKKITLYMCFQQFGTFTLALSMLIFSKKIKIQFNDIHIVTYLLSILILSIVSYVILKKVFLKKNQEERSVEIKKYNLPLQNILSVSFPLFLSGVLSFLMSWIDTFMLGIMKSTHEVGIYNVAMKLSTTTSIILFAVNTIMAPKISECWGKGDTVKLIYMAKKSSKLSFWASLPILLILFVYAPTILGIFGHEFSAATSTLRILICGQLINVIVGSVGYLLMLTDKEKIMQNVILLGVLTNITFNFILIPRLGYNGAAIASALSLIIINLLPVYFVKKYYKFCIINLL